ncbi:MAG TPA: hypothetical protein VG674_28245 [Amycolatopsis sp.]|nr:hypothetical protein [Amycolatopsis sp.]
MPSWLAMYAGAVAVLASFFVLIALWPKPRLGAPGAGRPLPWLERLANSVAVRTVLRAAGLTMLAIFLVTAWIGPDDGGRSNPVPYWIYVWFWVGLVPLSLLFGPIWRRLNPLRTLAGLVRSAVRNRVLPLPDRLGYWPAVLGLFAFVWMELIDDKAASPRTIAIFVTGYAVLHIIAGVVFGPEWFARGDAFEVYSWMVSRASPLGRRADGRLVLRNPLDGLAATPAKPDLTPVVMVVLGSTAFDGLSRTAAWSDVVADTGRAAYLSLGTAGLVAAIAVVAGTYNAAIWLTRRFVGSDRNVRAELAHGIIPIAIGYTVAHYFSFAMFEGQQGILLANDPLARGWDLLGLSTATIDYALMAPWGIALIQVAAIVVGHIVAVTAAHDRSVGMLPRRSARRGQYPMLVVMVCYTITGIALISGS